MILIIVMLQQHEQVMVKTIHVNIPTCNVFNSVELDKVHASFNTKFGLVICNTCNDMHLPSQFMQHYVSKHAARFSSG